MLELLSLSASIKKLEWASLISEEVTFEGEGHDVKADAFLWVIDIKTLARCISSIAVCCLCHNALDLSEEDGTRRGLATRLKFQCRTETCENHIHPISFDTTKKNGQSYDINLKNTLANRAIGKGRTASRTFCSIVGLSPPVTKQPWSNHTRSILEK